MKAVLIYNSQTGQCIYRDNDPVLYTLSLFLTCYKGTKRSCRSCLRRLLRLTHYQYAFHFTEGKNWTLHLYDNIPF